jgi:nucleoside-diphosphate-sugar epimerase
LNILIIGGTRFIGQEIVKSLSNLNVGLTVFSRSIKTNNSFNYVKGNRENIKDIKNIKGTFDVIIDFISYKGVHTEEIIRIFPNVRYILISTAWKIPDNIDIFKNEINYISNKRDAEKIVFKSRKNNHRNMVIRLPIVLGIGDHTKRTNFFRKGKKIVYLMVPDIIINFCWKNDIVDFVINEIFSKKKNNKSIVYPTTQYSLKLSEYIKIQMKVEEIEYQIKKISYRKSLTSLAFKDYLNNIGQNLYYPIKMFGKMKMKVNSLKKLEENFLLLKNNEPLK